MHSECDDQCCGDKREELEYLVCDQPRATKLGSLDENMRKVGWEMAHLVGKMKSSTEGPNIDCYE